MRNSRIEVSPHAIYVTYIISNPTPLIQKICNKRALGKSFILVWLVNNKHVNPFSCSTYQLSLGPDIMGVLSPSVQTTISTFQQETWMDHLIQEVNPLVLWLKITWIQLINFNQKVIYSSPEFVWKEPVGPTAIKFLNSAKLGEEYRNDLFVGDINNGYLYHFDLAVSWYWWWTACW